MEASGVVCCVHCNCMAGLGEAYTHIAAVLFYLEAVNRFEEAKTYTQGLCTWNVPTLRVDYSGRPSDIYRPISSKTTQLPNESVKDG